MITLKDRWTTTMMWLIRTLWELKENFLCLVSYELVKYMMWFELLRVKVYVWRGWNETWERWIGEVGNERIHGGRNASSGCVSLRWERGTVESLRSTFVPVWRQMWFSHSLTRSRYPLCKPPKVELEVQ
jgi:hypothetical protein